MRKRCAYLILALALLVGGIAWAAGNNCAITGTVQNIDGSNCANCSVTFDSQITQVLNGVTYQPLIASTTTDALGNLTAISLPQGLTVQIAVSENGQTFAPYTAIVPFLSAATFDQLNQGFTTDPLNVLASLQPPTGTLNMNGQAIDNLACPTATNGYALVWGCNATVNNLTVNGSFQQNVSGFGITGLLSVSQVANPSAPSVTAIGTTGATSYTYFIECHDGNGGATLPSLGTTITNGNATLSVSNYNQVVFTLPTGARSCDVLRGTTATSATGGLALTASPFNDTSNATSAYTAATRNTTGDGQFAGYVTSAGLIDSGALSVTGNATIGGTLGITGATSIASALTITGTSTPQLLIEGGGSTSQQIQLDGTGGTDTYRLEANNTDVLRIFDATNSTTDLKTDQSSNAISFPQGIEGTGGPSTAFTLPTSAGTVGQTIINNGSGGTSWGGLAHGSQYFAPNGSYTFTVPSGVAYIQIECWGGGGGGGGFGSGDGNGGAGGSTTVENPSSTAVCESGGGTGGTGSSGGSGAGGAGGGATIGTLLISGGNGIAGVVGGFGGSPPRSGGGFAVAGPAAQGGGGPGGDAGAGTDGGGGGGAGGYAEVVVAATPGTTFSIVNGAGGSAGAGGTAVGIAGASGTTYITW